LIKLLAAGVRNPDEMEGVIKQFAREPNSALLVLPDLFTATNRRSIIALAARHGLPAVYPFRYFVASGGLMSHGIETLEIYSRWSHPKSVQRGQSGHIPRLLWTRQAWALPSVQKDPNRRGPRLQ
jgi:hypothetical protein